MRTRLALIAAIAAVAAVIAGLGSRSPARGRAESLRRPAAAPEHAVAPPGRRPALLVLVADPSDRPLEGVRCDVEPWGTGAVTDSAGAARIPIAPGATVAYTVRVSREGYRPASRAGRYRAEGGEETVRLRLLEAPPIRVLDDRGSAIGGFHWDHPAADLRLRTLHAPGYLSLELRDLPGEILAPWRDLRSRTPIDLYMVPDTGLGCAVLRVDGGPGSVAMSVDLSRAALPDLAGRLMRLPPQWRDVYTRSWQAMRSFPRPAPGAPPQLLVFACSPGESVRVYAEGPIRVISLAREFAPVVTELEVAAGSTVERTIRLLPEPWTARNISVSDRYGRSGEYEVLVLEPVRLSLGRFGAASATVPLPPRGMPLLLGVDGGPRGKATRLVPMPPPPEGIAFELSGIEVRLRLLDQDTGESLQDLELRVEGRPEIAVRWVADEGVYVFGPVDPQTLVIAHDADLRFEVRVAADGAQAGVYLGDVRVRGVARKGAPATDTE